MTLPSDIFDGPNYNLHKHYLRVKRLHDAYPLNTREKGADHCSDIVAAIADAHTSDSLIDALCDFATAVLERETIYLPLLPQEALCIREMLETYERFFVSDAIAVATDTLTKFFSALREQLPQSVLEDNATALHVRFVDYIPQSFLNFVFADFIGRERSDGEPVFPSIKRQLTKNLLRASGYVGQVPAHPRLVWPGDSDLSPAEIAQTYFRDTPFVDLFMTPRPFDIPFRSRFEHHWIVAPPGAGKSTTLQYLIMRDLELVAANEASIVVMESNRDLIKAIEGLKVFAPGQRLDGKLVTIDAEDVEWPIALNLFDVGIDQTRSYSAADQEAFRNSVLSQYEYIFSALLSAEMTSRQHTLFQATIELLLSIPSATLDTLIDLMQPGGIKKYQNVVSTLDPDIQRFFELKFNTSEAGKTKEQVVDRLFAVKRNRTLARMFSAPKSKLDFFAEMGGAKVILINLPQSLLQEDGVEITGRFFISMILLAAHKRQLLPKEQRLPCFVYIDECQDFIKRDPKIPTILDQARKLNVGLILAHQRLQQLHPSVLDALYGATAIKFASKVSDSAAHALARDMRTTPEFILNQPPYHFAAYIRGVTDAALSIRIPDTDMNRLPRMTTGECAAVRGAIRQRYAISRDPKPPGPALSAEVPATEPKAAQSASATGADIRSGREDDWRS
jgi:DNA helicase HerA-like ATPase